MAWRPSPRDRSRVANPGTGLRRSQNEQARVRLPVHFIFFAAGGGANSCSLETGCFRNQRTLSDSFVVMAGLDPAIQAPKL